VRPPVSLSLSDHEWSAQIRIGLDHCVVSDPQLADEDCDRPNGLLAFPPNSISVGHFADCCRALGEPLSAGDVDRLAEAGQTYYSACLRRWMSRVMEEDRMVDSFVEFFPNARGRFTSWEQYTNGRYVNEGARLDYILVDEALFRSHAVRGPLPPDCTEDTFDAPETALQLATANGN